MSAITFAAFVAGTIVIVAAAVHAVLREVDRRK